MPKPFLTRAYVDLWNKIHRHYKLKTIPHQDPQVGGIIQFTADADEWLMDKDIKNYSSGQVTADGLFTITTIPDNEEWHIQHINVLRSSGNYDFDWVRFDTADGDIHYIFKDDANSITEHIENYGQTIKLPPKTEIRVRITNHVADGAMRLSAIMGVFEVG